jgi:SAM-dependent methyltransferase
VICVACGGGPARGKLRVGGVEILECPECGLAWWTPPADFHAESVYDGSYFEGADAAHGYDDYGALEASLRATFAGRLARLPRPQARARLLDVGAAFGFAVDEARRAGWLACGIEVSRPAARRAAREAVGRVVVGSGLSVPFASAAFDAVTLWDVLEHLPDPHAAIAEVRRLLRPGGRVVLTTGDAGSLVARASGARWHLYTLPEHLFFYTRRSLRALLSAHGLRVEEVTTEPSWYTLGYLVERLRKSLLGRRARRAAAWPGARLRVPLNLFDVVTVRAVRTDAT